MRTISNIDELKENLNLFEYYLCDGNEKEVNSICKLIAGGLCFVAYKAGEEYRFAPSRFVGYFKNDLIKHTNNHSKDGRITNPAIDKIFNKKLSTNVFLEEEYFKFCYKIGVLPHNKKRKFWSFYLGFTDFDANVVTNEGFPEGKIVERKHKARERNSELIESAKSRFKQTHGKLYCQVCNFDFEKIYGSVGKDFIEAHHTVPVSEMNEEYKTTIDEIAIVCSNCHRMLHRRRPWLKINELKKIIG